MDERGSAKAWIVAFVIAMPLSLGGLIGIGCALGANACPFGSDAPEPRTGEEIWLANCALCHGIEGAGTAANPNAPSLVDGASASLAMDALVAAIEDGTVGLMPRFEGKLTDDQIDAVARYVIALRGDTDE